MFTNKFNFYTILYGINIHIKNEGKIEKALAELLKCRNSLRQLFAELLHKIEHESLL